LGPYEDTAMVPSLEGPAVGPSEVGWGCRRTLRFVTWGLLGLQRLVRWGKGVGKALVLNMGYHVVCCSGGLARGLPTRQWGLASGILLLIRWGFMEQSWSPYRESLCSVHYIYMLRLKVCMCPLPCPWPTNPETLYHGPISYPPSAP